jgi:hypothetical protein
MELMVSSMLHRQDNMNWQEDELMPIADLDIRRIMPSGSVLGAFITLKDGRRFTVDFNEIDSKRSC